MHSLIDTALNRFFEEHGGPAINPFSWKDGLDLLSGQEIEVRTEQLSQLGNELSALRVQALSLGALAIHAWHHEPANRVLKRDFDARDMSLGAWLTNVCNTILAIARLCEDGFDTQARCLFRCLQERTKQAIILFYSGEDYNEWHKAFEADESKSAFYTLFSRKNRLGRRYAEIERSLGFPVPPSAVEQRRADEERASQAIHGSSVAVLIGSFGSEHGSDRVYPAIFGYASSASGSTLMQSFWDVLWFQMVLEKLLNEVHGWKPDLGSQFPYAYASYKQAGLEVAGKFINDLKQ